MTEICAGSLQSLAALAELYVRTRQYFVFAVNVPAAHTHCCSAPVTVASAVHVFPSELVCNSAFVCGVPVDVACPHTKGWSTEPLTTTSFGLMAHALGGESPTPKTIQSEVSVCSAFVFATTRQSMLLPLIVPAGTVTFGASPAHVVTGILVIADCPWTRNCNVKLAIFSSSSDGSSVFCANENVKMTDLLRSTIEPSAGEKSCIVPVASSSDTSIARYGLLSLWLE